MNKRIYINIYQLARYSLVLQQLTCILNQKKLTEENRKKKSTASRTAVSQSTSNCNLQKKEILDMYNLYIMCTMN